MMNKVGAFTTSFFQYTEFKHILASFWNFRMASVPAECYHCCITFRYKRGISFLKCKFLEFVKYGGPEAQIPPSNHSKQKHFKDYDK